MKNNIQDYQYQKIAQAISFIANNFKSQPSLEEIASHIHLSPFHFQRLFREWVGISPKQYLKYISSNYAKSLLAKSDLNLFDTADELGYSGTGRLHDLFITIDGMTPGEYRKGGANLSIKYSFENTPFGEILIASTKKGICHMAFVETEEETLEELQLTFPNARYTMATDELQKNALSVFHDDWQNLDRIKLHLKATDFQLKVWESLLTIPYGALSTYGSIAKKIEKPKASRAVGTAIGSNPIAYLIPCHRVVQQSGKIGGYRWNPTRKKAMIAWEAIKKEQLQTL